MFISRSGVALNKTCARQVQGMVESRKPAPTPDQDAEVLAEPDDTPTLSEDTDLTEMDRLRQGAAQGVYRLTSS